MLVDVPSLDLLADLDGPPLVAVPEKPKRGRPALERPIKKRTLWLYEDQYEALIEKVGSKTISDWVRELLDRELGTGADGKPS